MRAIVLSCTGMTGESSHILNSTCTHLGCNVKWKAAEKSWNCPCHGSRFSIDGKVLTGPAREGSEKLQEKELK